MAAAAVAMAALLSAGTAEAGLYTFNSGTLNQAIPDNSAAGLAYQFKCTLATRLARPRLLKPLWPH